MSPTPLRSSYQERSFGGGRAGRSNSKPKIYGTIPNTVAVKGGITHGSTFVKDVIYTVRC
ncbi:hypothetical protein N656DRAFT_777505, partial [Canariomyces notabilis]